MFTVVKKTISLPIEMAREVETIASEEGKTVSAVIHDALRMARRQRLKREFYHLQGCWSKKARERGVLTEKDLETTLTSL